MWPHTFSNVGSTGGISLSILGQAVSADSQQVSIQAIMAIIQMGIPLMTQT